MLRHRTCSTWSNNVVLRVSTTRSSAVEAGETRQSTVITRRVAARALCGARRHSGQTNPGSGVGRPRRDDAVPVNRGLRDERNDFDARKATKKNEKSETETRGNGTYGAVDSLRGLARIERFSQSEKEKIRVPSRALPPGAKDKRLTTIRLGKRSGSAVLMCNCAYP